MSFLSRKTQKQIEANPGLPIAQLMETIPWRTQDSKDTQYAFAVAESYHENVGRRLSVFKGDELIELVLAPIDKKIDGRRVYVQTVTRRKLNPRMTGGAYAQAHSFQVTVGTETDLEAFQMPGQNYADPPIRLGEHQEDKSISMFLPLEPRSGSALVTREYDLYRRQWIDKDTGAITNNQYEWRLSGQEQANLPAGLKLLLDAREDTSCVTTEEGRLIIRSPVFRKEVKLPVRNDDAWIAATAMALNDFQGDKMIGDIKKL